MCTIKLPGCTLLGDKEFKKQRHGFVVYQTETGSNNISLKWRDNKSVNHVSTYVGKEPI